jgi:hypothetical protein
MIDLEISLVKAFNWSLYEIDATDIESLLPFVARFAGSNGEPAVKKQVYCDQVSWL